MRLSKHISLRAEQLISEYDLGHVKAEYREGSLKTGLLLSLFLLVGLVCLALALPARSNWLENAGNFISLLFFGGCFTLIGAFGPFVLMVALWRGEQKIYLSDRGYISERRRVVSVHYWEAIKQIRRKVRFIINKANNIQSVGVTQSYTLILAEGKKEFFHSEPGPAIEEAVTAYQLPRILMDYAAGKTLSFGWLALNQEGLHLTPGPVDHEIPPKSAKVAGRVRVSHKLQGTSVLSGSYSMAWDELACYWIDESRSTFILIRKNEYQHWAILPLSQVSNSALCRAIIEHALSGKSDNID